MKPCRKVTRLGLVALLAFALLFLLGPGVAVGQVQTIPRIVPLSGAVLGSAYDSVAEKVLANECVTGNESDTGVQSASFSLLQTMSESETIDALNFSANAHANFGVTQASASAKFLSKAVSNSFSVSSIWYSDYYFPIKRLTGLKYSDPGQTLSASDGDWTEACGDRYVVEIRRGARLFVSIRIEFASIDQKREFEAEFSVNGPWGGVGGNLATATKKFGKNITVSVAATQLGGDVSKLTAFLNKDKDGSSQNYLDCTLGSFESCAKFIGFAIAYAADTTTGFPSQLAPDVKPGPAVLAYSLAPYPPYIHKKASAILAPAVAQKRRELEERFTEQFKHSVTADRLITMPRLSNVRRELIKSAKAAIDNNIQAIIAIDNVCYDSPQDCLAAAAELNLRDIDESLLAPDTFRSLCEAGYNLQTNDPLRITLDAMIDNVGGTGITPRFAHLDCYIYDRLLNKQTSLFLGEAPEIFGAPIQTEISDLAPIASLTKLESLFVPSGKIADLSSLSLLANLQELDISGNKVSSLTALEGLVELQTLNIQDNRVADLGPLSSLVQLRTLLAGNNLIASVKPLAGLTNLLSLYLAHNSLRTLSELPGPDRLIMLDVTDNLFESTEPIQQFRKAHSATYISFSPTLPPPPPVTSQEQPAQK